MTTTTLGFLGAGDISDTLIEALLDDQISAAGDVVFVLPYSKEYDTPAMAEVWSLAQERQIPVVAITDHSRDKDLLTRFKPKKIVSLPGQAARGVVRELEKTANPKLLVFWDQAEMDKGWESTEFKQIYMALRSSVEVRNLCDAGTGLESLHPDGRVNFEQESSVTTEEVTIYSQEELEGMSDDEVTAVALTYEIDATDVEAYPNWDVVIEAIIEAQGVFGDDGLPAEHDAEEDTEEPAGYTRDALEAMNLDELKEIVRNWGLTLNPQWKRPRADKYIETILAAQTATPEGEEAEEEAPAAAEAEYEEIEGTYISATPIDLEPVVAAIQDVGTQVVQAIAALVKVQSEGVTLQTEAIIAALKVVTSATSTNGDARVRGALAPTGDVSSPRPARVGRPRPVPVARTR